jgi:gamma-glutamylcyclotransferase (GGCT)/AIG2-like uncharacterized protein YtfP
MGKVTREYLFVYGTLRRDSKSELYHLLARYGDFVGDATYQGKLYMVDYYPGVVPSDDARDVVHGEAYRLTCSDIVLARLDEYEECSSGFPDPTEYVRRNEKVKLNTGEVIAAWVYIFNRSTAGLQPIQSGDYYEMT